MSINVNDKNLGHATAYAYYKAGGGTMTEAEFTEFMADFGTASQTAVEAAQAALASKNAAQTAATTATNKASEATTAATTATNKAAEAQADADAAALDASQALSAASTATTKATEATTAAATAVSAKDDAVSANTAAQSAKTAAQTAQTGAETAAASVSASAAQIQTNADDISELKEDTTQLKNELTFGAENICPTKNTTETSHGITYTPMGDGSYKVNGTSTAHVHYNLYQNTSGFLDGFQAGDSFLTYYDNPSNSAVKFWVAFIVGGAEQWQNFQSGYNTLTIPSNATGMKVRLTILNGNTVNNVIVKPYIFNSKTKHEYDEEIGANTENVDKILDAMSYGYNPMSVQTINGLINIYGETVTPDGYAYARISVAEGEKYKVSGWYYAVGGNFPAYMLMNGNTRVSFYAPSTQGAFYGAEVTIPSGVTDLYVNGYPDGGAPVVVLKYGLAKVGAKSYDSILVGTTSDYDYTNINTAILNNNGSIISVDYGTYETEIENLATNKKVIGKDVDLCVLTGTDKDYDHPPIEIAGGIIKNFTVNMVNSSSATHKGYCLHSDNAACADNTLTVENCKFSCIGQHSVGMGIYPNEEVVFKNCCFENLGLEAIMPIYMHNSGASDGVAVVRFHNCYFAGQKYAIQLQGWGSNANIKFEFINCTCTSVTYGTSDDCVWTDYVSGSTHDTSRMHEFSGKFSLMATSHGNNVSVLNA